MDPGLLCNFSDAAWTMGEYGSISAWLQRSGDSVTVVRVPQLTDTKVVSKVMSLGFLKVK